MADPYVSSIQVLDGTNDISSLIDWTTLDLVIVLTKEKGTLSFDIVCPKAPTFPTNMPVLGDTIYLNYTISGVTVKLFGGTVTGTEIVNDGGKLLRNTITCPDWAFKFDSKLVKKTYVDMDPKAIVLDIVANFAGAGFTTVNVQEGGFLVSTIQFNYEQVDKAIEALASQIGWDWYIDPNKDVHFFFAGNYLDTSEDYPAPFNIDDTSGNLDYESLDVDVDISNMKNSIYVVGGTYAKTFQIGGPTGTYPPVDNYTSVAGTLVYPLAYPYDQSTMTVTLAGTAQSIGTDNSTDPTTVEVLYNDTNYFLRFTSDPGAGKAIVVQGNARIPIVAHVTNAAAIAEFGEIQDAIIDSSITSVQEAQERGTSEIVQFGHPVYDVKFTSISPLANKLYIGQTIMLNSASYGISNYPLIIKRIECVPRNGYLMEFEVEAIGSDTVTYTDMMLYLLQQQNANTPTASNVVLQVILDVQESLIISDTITLTSGTRPYKWGPGTPQPRWGFFTWN